MNYPYIGCLNPKSVPNKKKKGDKILVSCGNCPACMNKKLSRYKRLCELEELSNYKYTYFVTLTYSDDYIPCYRMVQDENGRYLLKDLNPRSSSYGSLLDDTFCITDSERNLLNSKCNIAPDTFSYLYYRDIQLFNKKLRKSIIKDYGTKIRMFAVGEYGPLHLRAHWHLIYFSENPLPSIFNTRFIGTLWKYGRTDADRSFGGSIGYAAGYLNSSYVLPRLYKSLKITPFARHSVKLGLDYIKKSTFEGLDSLLSLETSRGKSFTANYVSDGVSKPLPLDKTHKDSFFPKPPRFDVFKSDKSFLQYLRAYEFYRGIFRDVDSSSVKDLAKCVYESLYVLRIGLTDYDKELKFILQKDDISDPFFEDDLERAQNRLYRFLLWSKLYCSRCAHDSSYLSKLFAFYDAQDYNSLLYQLQAQEEHSNDVSFTSDALDCYYATTYTFKKLTQTLAYSTFLNAEETKHKNKLKRKKFNDLARVLG